jgi:hypothetical protein
MFINRELSSYRGLTAAFSARRGVSMMMVMVSLSTSVVLTYAILQTQSVSSQVNQNALRTDLASQAAQTGAAIALERMQSADWKGVDSPLSQVISSDGDGTLSYAVEFQRYPPETKTGSYTVHSETGLVDGATSGVYLTADATLSATSSRGGTMPEGHRGDPALVVCVSSLGVWQSNHDLNQRAIRKVEVLVLLEPRLPGRALVSEDHAAAEDVAANPGDFDRIQTYTLVARSQQGKNSLVIDPGTRVDGRLWAEKGGTALFNDPIWSKTIRTQVLRELGWMYVTSKGGNVVVQHPHPFGDQLAFRSQPESALRTELGQLAILWTRNEKAWVWPEVDFAAWKRYRIYQGGFAYDAQKTATWLNRVTLRPSDSNPLGVFYVSGSMTIQDDVTIQGTLVCDKTVKIVGNRVRVGSYNWRESDGSDHVADAQLIPRLPAIVANSVEFSRDTTARIEGTVVVRKSVTGAGGSYELPTNSLGQVDNVEYTGLATVRPLQQPLSEVVLLDKLWPTSLMGREEFAIWLTEGSSGAWYPIASVDPGAKSLTVIGEAPMDGPVSYRIKRIRKRSVDIIGPVLGEWHDFNRPDDWGNLSAAQWNTLYTNWLTVVSKAPAGTTPPRFIEFLANPNDFSGAEFGAGYSRLGLNLEPTLHLRRNGRVAHHWSPPLFEPYAGTADNGKHAGYRWKVLTWREMEGGTTGDVLVPLTVDQFNSGKPYGSGIKLLD